MSSHGVGRLHIVSGTVKAMDYIEILQNKLLPTARDLLENQPCIFQDDNAPCHRAKIVQKWALCSSPGEGINICKCIVPSRQEGSLNSRRAADLSANTHHAYLWRHLKALFKAWRFGRFQVQQLCFSCDFCKIRSVKSRRKQPSAFDQVSEFDIGRIVAYRDCGLSFRKIGSRVGRNQTTEMRICDLWMQEGTTDRHGRSHLPQCTTSREDRLIVRMTVTDRSFTSRTVAQHI
ncbi:transposable element Tc1 transposase [Trichonephila clavipes]|nr:transposable element Tc1 transposase [Trichonephila clavipes]